MVRWRLCLAIAIMLLLPIVIGSKHNDDDDDDEDSENKEDFRVSKMSKPKFNQNNRRVEEGDDDEEDDDEEDDEGGEEKGGSAGVNRGSMMVNEQEPLAGNRAPMLMATPKSILMSGPRTPKKRPLECFVCAYKQETPLRACLDPTKFRVHTITCHSTDDRCFTSVIFKGDNYETVVRGCRSGCVATGETSCCDINRCNNKAFAMPQTESRQREVLKSAPATKSKSSKCMPPTVVFFITILLILQTVGKVTLI